MAAASLTPRPQREAVTFMDPTRDRNLIWLASGSAARRAGKTNLATAWDVAAAQMAAAQQAGDLADAARWEAQADALFAQIPGQQPNHLT